MAKKKKVLIEWPEEPESRPSRVPPFLLGMLVMFIATVIPVLAALYHTCHDVDVTPVCPHYVANKSRNLFRKTKFPPLIVLPPVDPKQGMCQLWKSFSSSRTEDVATTDYHTCTPSLWQSDDAKDSANPTILKRYTTSYTSSLPDLTNDQQQLLERLSTHIQTQIPDLHQRIAQVPWGGPDGPPWMDLQRSTTQHQIPGTHLFFSYLRIMQWNWHSKFPFSLCGQAGCDAPVAIEHSLKYRELFRPWIVTQSMKLENQHGSCYTHGFGRTPIQDGAHALVWVRPGKRVKKDDVIQNRIYMHTLDRAVARSLEASQGRVGKFNVIVDGTGFSWGLLPSLRNLKIFVTMLQDHFPDRLGIILLCHLGRVGEALVKLFLPLITQEVRNKIVVLTRKNQEEVLEELIGFENVPAWLGGSDSYVFDVKEYYQGDVATEEEAKAYLTTMPYHA